MPDIMEWQVYGLHLVFLVPFILLVGSVIVTLFYQLVLRDLVNPSKELKESRRLARKRMDEERIKELEKPRKKLDIDDKMTTKRFVLQVISYSIFAAVIGYFSSNPTYVRAAQDASLFKISINHPGKRKVPCRRRTKEELSNLAPNMRAPMSCSRERWSVSLKLVMDGKVVYEKTVPPSGLWRDSKSSFYESFFMPSGEHHMRMVMNDGGGKPENDYVLETDVNFLASHVIIAGFDDKHGKLFIK